MWVVAGEGRVAVLEILKSTMRTRDYVLKGETEGRSLTDAMHDGQVDGMQMPAKGAKLTREHIGILRAWIDQGAHWPDSASAKNEDKLAWWSLQPIRNVPLPTAAESHPLDAFIRAKLTELEKSPEENAEDIAVLMRSLAILGYEPKTEIA